MLLASNLPLWQIEAIMSGESETTSDESKTDSLRRHHKMILVISVIIIVLAFLFHVRQDQRIEFVFLSDAPLPHTCMSRALLGWSCPLCGLTRSFIFLAHGRWAESFGVHRLGWFIALAVVAQVPYRIVSLNCPGRLVLGRVFPKAFGLTLIGVLFGNWLIGLFL